MLSAFNSILSREGLQSKIYCPAKGKKVHTLEIQAGERSIAFLDWIYDGADVFLERKYKRYKEYKQNVHFESNLVDKTQVNCGELLRASTTNHPQE